MNKLNDTFIDIALILCGQEIIEIYFEIILIAGI